MWGRVLIITSSQSDCAGGNNRYRLYVGNKDLARCSLICCPVFVGAGGALSTGGPLGVFLGYSIMGLVVGSMMVARSDLALPTSVGTEEIRMADGGYLRRWGSSPLPIPCRGRSLVRGWSPLTAL